MGQGQTKKRKFKQFALFIFEGSVTEKMSRFFCKRKKNDNNWKNIN